MSSHYENTPVLKEIEVAGVNREIRF